MMIFFGKTPKKIENLSANVDIAIKIRKEQHRDHFYVLRIGPDETKILQTRLISIKGDFGSTRIESTPPRAKIFLDGKPLREKTPVLINELDVNVVHYLVLQLEGYQEYVESFRVNRSKTQTIKVYLKTKPEKIQ